MINQEILTCSAAEANQVRLDAMVRANNLRLANPCESSKKHLADFDQDMDYYFHSRLRSDLVRARQQIVSAESAHMRAS
jgi:hypothetical protein